MNRNLLIVDDNIQFSNSLAENFKRFDYKCFLAKNSIEALQILNKKNINLILLDIMLGKERGIDVLKKILKSFNNIPVIMITGFPTIECAVDSIKFGAYDYIQKPIKFDKLLKIIKNAVSLYSLKTENKNLKKRLEDYSDKIITKNKSMKELLNKAKKFANTDLPIFIRGENGTGKEVLADFIHSNSERNMYNIIKINCAAFPDALLDNELFGHEKGAYTGAHSTYKGVFEHAENSTLFMDEVGDMSAQTQAKLLRVLQNHEIKKLGANNTVKINVRIIAATNKNIESLIEEGKFREDLYYRLNTAMITIPPLREKKEDIPILINFFLKEYSEKNNKIIKYITDKAMSVLLDYNWPGNIRELRNTIFYAATLTNFNYIDTESLPSNFLIKTEPNTSVNIREEVEKDLLIKTLQKFNYNKKKVAENLKISRTTLYSKIKKFQLSI